MSIEKKCKNCRFWDTDADIVDPCTYDEYDESVNVGECTSKKIKDISEIGVSAKDIDVDGAGVTDHDNYKAAFLTGPEFGCIHFEEK